MPIPNTLDAICYETLINRHSSNFKWPTFRTSLSRSLDFSVFCSAESTASALCYTSGQISVCSLFDARVFQERQVIHLSAWVASCHHSLQAIQRAFFTHIVAMFFMQWWPVILMSLISALVTVFFWLCRCFTLSDGVFPILQRLLAQSSCCLVCLIDRSFVLNKQSGTGMHMDGKSLFELAAQEKVRHRLLLFPFRAVVGDFVSVAPVDNICRSCTYSLADLLWVHWQDLWTISHGSSFDLTYLIESFALIVIHNILLIINVVDSGVTSALGSSVRGWFSSSEINDQAIQRAVWHKLFPALVCFKLKFASLIWFVWLWFATAFSSLGCSQEYDWNEPTRNIGKTFTQTRQCTFAFLLYERFADLKLLLSLKFDCKSGSCCLKLTPDELYTLHAKQGRATYLVEMKIVDDEGKVSFLSFYDEHTCSFLIRKGITARWQSIWPSSCTRPWVRSWFFRHHSSFLRCSIVRSYYKEKKPFVDAQNWFKTGNYNVLKVFAVPAKFWCEWTNCFKFPSLRWCCDTRFGWLHANHWSFKRCHQKWRRSAGVASISCKPDVALEWISSIDLENEAMGHPKACDCLFSG